MSKASIIELRHPEYQQMNALWRKYRLAYDGGADFITAYLERYSKRETQPDYAVRKRISYNPGHAKAAINMVRNALCMKSGEVQRVGDARYLDAMATDVDLFSTTMPAFVGLEIVPLLLAQGKRFVLVDAPPAMAGATLMEDKGRPYLVPVNAEDVLSWHYGLDGNLDAVIMRELVDVVDESGFMAQSVARYRYMRLLAPGEQVRISLSKGQGLPGVTGNLFEFTGPGVLVRWLNDESKECSNPVLLPLSVIPLVEFKLVDALMTDIADMQIALLNLASSDMSFLFRGNFPIYTEQFDGARVWTKRAGSGSSGADELDDSTGGGASKSAGAGSGIGYQKGLERPEFIAPPVANLEASMKKQEAIRQEIRLMLDLALTSMSVKALEQSGKSKEADMVGEEAGLSYIAGVLEGGERQIAYVWHQLLGTNPDVASVKYPVGFSIQTPEQRMAQVQALRGVSGAARSERYTKAVQRRIVELIMKPLANEQDVSAAQAEVDAAPYFDEDKERAALVKQDLDAGLVSSETATVMRGYGEAEVMKAAVQREMDADMANERMTKQAQALVGAAGQPAKATQEAPDADETAGPGEQPAGEE